MPEAAYPSRWQPYAQANKRAYGGCELHAKPQRLRAYDVHDYCYELLAPPSKLHNRF